MASGGVYYLFWKITIVTTLRICNRKISKIKTHNTLPFDAHGAQAAPNL